MRLRLALGLSLLVVGPTSARPAAVQRHSFADAAPSQSAISLGNDDHGVSGASQDTVLIQVGAPVHATTGRLVEDLTLGKLDGDPRYVFGNVSGIAIDASGSIYVADQLNAVIRMYDSTGAHVLSFGRRGDGPGEFSGGTWGLAQWDGPSDIALTARGLVASSERGRGVHFYSRTGAPLLDVGGRDFQHSNVLDRRIPRISVDRTGNIFVQVELRVGSIIRYPGRPRGRLAYLRLTPDGSIIDTMRNPGRADNPPIAYAGELPQPGRWAQVPFTPTFTWGLSPRGYFVTGMAQDYGGRYAIDLRVPPAATLPATRALASRPQVWKEGDRVVSLRVPYDRVPVQPREAADWIRYYETSIRRTDKYENWSWNGPRPPAYKPPYTQFWVDEEERIWVSLRTAAVFNANERMVGERWMASERWKEQPMFQLVTADGRNIGKLAYTGEIYPQVARGDRMWAIVWGEFGFIQVKRYRIVW